MRLIICSIFEIFENSSEFFNTLFDPFSCNVTLNRNSAYDELVKEKNEYLQNFRKVVSK